MTDRPWNVASDQAKRAAVRAALELERGNITRAAKRLQIDRSHLHRLLEGFELVGFAEKLRLGAGGTRGRDGKVTGRPNRGRIRKLSH